MSATATLTRPAPRRPRTGTTGGANAATAVAFPRTWGPYRAPSPQPARLQVVPARTRARRRRRTMLYGWIAVMALLTVVAFHAFLAQNQIALDHLEQRTAAAEQRYEEARYRHSLAASPARITTRAMELGLVLPGQPATVVPIAGDVPAPPDATSDTLDGWTDVKPTLTTNP